MDGRGAPIILNISAAGANVIEVVDASSSSCAAAGGPAAAVDVAVLTTAPSPSGPRCADVQIELLFAVALVVLVIFLFLRQSAGDHHPCVAVSVSLIGTFASCTSRVFHQQPEP